MLVLLLACSLAPPAGLRAGAAKCEITPPTGYPMWGYAARRDAPCTGVLDKLHARALVIETDGRRMALVSLDLGRAPTRNSTAAVEKQARAHGVDVVFLAGSHTHHGPVIEVDTWPTAKDSYVRGLERKLGALIAEAVKDLRPARVGVASKEAALNRNRHTRDGAVDRQLLVLRAETLDGKPIAHAVNFAAHPTMRPAKDHRFSADWVGPMAAHVEAVTGAPCLFLQGAAGRGRTGRSASAWRWRRRRCCFPRRRRRRSSADRCGTATRRCASTPGCR
jgi:neutral ceramidase